MGEAIPIFEIGRGDDVDLDVALPAPWARSFPAIQIVFEESAGRGWHLKVESSNGDDVLGFPWCDHVEEMLRGDRASELPDQIPGGAWDDVDQGWWGAVRVDGDWVFVAETDFERLCGVRGVPIPRLHADGTVVLSDVPVTWSRIPRAAWDNAWAAARESCKARSPAPRRARRT